MRDRNHLETVRERRTAYGGNLTSCASSGCGGLSEGQFFVWRRDRQRQPDRRGEQQGCPRHRVASGRGPLALGMIVNTSRFSGVKYVFATRWTSATVRFWKISNSPSAVLMSL